MYSSAELVKSLLCWLQDNVNFEYGPDNHWEKGEDHIVEGDGPGEPEGPARSQIIKAVGKLHRCEDHVLVEKVENHLGNPHVVNSPVVEQQFPQQAKLADGVIGNLGCSRSLLTKDPDPYMSLHYHIYVISPISYCQSQLPHILYDSHNLCLLPRSYAAKDS